MNRLRQRQLSTRALSILAGSALLSGAAQAQYVFSVDFQSGSLSAPDSFGAVPITEGDLLTPAGGVPLLGPLPAPGIDVSGGLAGLGMALHAGCVGHTAYSPCGVELDAVSYGVDKQALPNVGFTPGEILFSVDSWAKGFPNPPAPDVTSEAGCMDSAADLFSSVNPMPPAPVPPFAAVPGNVATVDGDGMPSACGIVYPGVGLREPTFPAVPQVGDNLDAINIDGPVPPGGFGFPATGVYFSMDGVVTHPFSGITATGSAIAHGFFGGDILYSATPGGPPVVWAPAPMLGLNLAGALDDLDALAIWENGNGTFDPSTAIFDWIGGAHDMVLFSVRAGSPVIGMPDSVLGIPIEPGDILTTPVAGGFSPFPGIVVAAENLGLLTHRTHGLPGDDLVALDLISNPLVDCNGNGIDDMIDILSTTSTDINGNFVPDECEIIGGPTCFCPGPVAPCANPYLTGGCENSTAVGAILGGSGSGSVSLDNLVLTATQLPTFKPGIFFGGTTLIGPFPFGDGLRCTGGNIVRYSTVLNSGATGTMSIGPGLATSFGIPAFATHHFQCWYRDPAGPCLTGFNTSNAFSVTFTP